MRRQELILVYDTDCSWPLHDARWQIIRITSEVHLAHTEGARFGNDKARIRQTVFQTQPPASGSRSCAIITGCNPDGIKPKPNGMLPSRGIWSLIWNRRSSHSGARHRLLSRFNSSRKHVQNVLIRSSALPPRRAGGEGEKEE